MRFDWLISVALQYSIFRFGSRAQSFGPSLTVWEREHREMSAEPHRRNPYSVDLRWRVVWQRVGMNLTFKQISRRLNIDPSTACRIYNLFKVTGDVQPKLKK